MSDIVWSDPEWLQYYPLNRMTALDYFARSAFYDPGCNNELLKQQGLDLSRLPTLPPGIEFVLHDMQEPHLYVICKQHRHSPKQTESLAFYDILDGKIYQMPTLHAALSSRMNRCLYNVRTAFDKIQQDIDPLLKVDSAKEGVPEAASDVKMTEGQVQRNKVEAQRQKEMDHVLFNVVQMHSKLLPSRQQTPRLPSTATVKEEVKS